MSMIPGQQMGGPMGSPGMGMAPSMSGSMAFPRSLFGGMGRGMKAPPNPAAHPQAPQSQPATADVVGQMAQQAHQQNAQAKIAGFEARRNEPGLQQPSSVDPVKTAYEQYQAQLGQSQSTGSTVAQAQTGVDGLPKGQKTAAAAVTAAASTAAADFHGNPSTWAALRALPLTNKRASAVPPPAQALPADPGMGPMSTAISAPPAAPAAAAPAPVGGTPPAQPDPAMGGQAGGMAQAPAPAPAAGGMAAPAPAPGMPPVPGQAPAQMPPGTMQQDAGVQQSMGELFQEANAPDSAGDDMKFQNIVQASDHWGLERFAKTAAPGDLFDVEGDLAAMDAEQQPAVKQKPALPPVAAKPPATRPAAPATQPAGAPQGVRPPQGTPQAPKIAPGPSGSLPGASRPPVQPRPVPVQPGAGRAQPLPTAPPAAKPVPVRPPATRPAPVAPGSGMINGKPASQVLKGIPKQGSTVQDDAAEAALRTFVFGKQAWQDNGVKDRTSASGESTNVGFAHRNDDYDRGPAAWENSAKYLKHGAKGGDRRIPSSSTTKLAKARQGETTFGQDSKPGDKLAQLVKKILSKRGVKPAPGTKQAANLANEAKRQGIYQGATQAPAPAPAGRPAAATKLPPMVTGAAPAMPKAAGYGALAGVGAALGGLLGGGAYVAANPTAPSRLAAMGTDSTAFPGAVNSVGGGALLGGAGGALVEYLRRRKAEAEQPATLPGTAKAAAAVAAKKPFPATAGLLQTENDLREDEEAEKVALTVEDGGLPSRALANTVGHVGNTLGLAGPIMSLRSYVNPQGTPQRRQKHEESAGLLEAAEPDALSGTKLRLGGSDLVDDLLWKREEPGQDLPWTQQIGGRNFQNPRTGPLGKALGLISTPLAALQGNLLRAPHYNPETDVATNYWDERGVTEHELGHAIDFNTVSSEKGKGKVSDSWLGRQGRGTVRDLYRLAYGIPGVNLWHEAQANRKSWKALESQLGKGSDKLLEHEYDRAKVLPAGYGSYIGNTLSPLLGPAGAIGGMVGGKVVGTARRDAIESEQRARAAEKRRGWSERDGDNDGHVNDGRPDERDYRKAAGFLDNVKNTDWKAALPGVAGRAGVGAALGGGVAGIAHLMKGDEEKKRKGNGALATVGKGALLGGGIGTGIGLSREVVGPALKKGSAVDRLVKRAALRAFVKKAAVTPGLAQRLRKMKAEKTVRQYQPATDSIRSGDSDNDVKAA